MTEPIRLERLTIRRGRKIACADVSLAVPRGAVYALLGRNGAGKSSLIECITGKERPFAGRALVFGEDSWRRRRHLRKRIALRPEELGGDRELLVLLEPKETLQICTDATVFLATADPTLVTSVATNVGILRRGHLVYDATTVDVDRRLRRIRYVNRMTESRTAFGTELDEFHSLQVQVRGWGIEAIVADFEPEAFARFRALDGVEDVSVETMTLSEVFEALG